MEAIRTQQAKGWKDNGARETRQQRIRREKAEEEAGDKEEEERRIRRDVEYAKRGEDAMKIIDKAGEELTDKQKATKLYYQEWADRKPWNTAIEPRWHWLQKYRRTPEQ